MANEKAPETQGEWGEQEAPQAPAPKAPAPPKELDKLLSKGVTTFGESGFEIKNTDDLDRWCRAILASDMAPYGIVGKCDQPTALARLKIAVDFGASVGFTRHQSLQYVYVVNNRPCVWGDGILALCFKHGAINESPKIEYEGLAPDGTVGAETVCVCKMRRKGEPDYVEIRYGMADAKKAGLSGKAGSWSTNPKDMLRRKCIARGASIVAADALAGIVVDLDEEIGVQVSGADATAARLAGAV